MNMSNNINGNNIYDCICKQKEMFVEENGIEPTHCGLSPLLYDEYTEFCARVGMREVGYIGNCKVLPANDLTNYQICFHIDKPKSEIEEDIKRNKFISYLLSKDNMEVDISNVNITSEDLAQLHNEVLFEEYYKKYKEDNK